VIAFDIMKFVGFWFYIVLGVPEAVAQPSAQCPPIPIGHRLVISVPRGSLS
jgi:hypothetical protein